MARWLFAWGLLWLAFVGSPSTIEAQACIREGQVLQGGHCCWPGQHYDATADRCAGVPACPPNFAPQGEDACAPVPPAPPVCAAGRVSVGGYCCWPGQTFDLAANRCIGPPACPAGFVGAGAECERTTTIEPTAAIEPAVRREPTAQATTRARPTAARPTPAAIPPARERDIPLLAGGAVLFFLPYLSTIFAHYGLGTSYNREAWLGDRSVAPLWPLTLFPITHNFAMISNTGGSAAGAMWLIGFLAGACEIAGLVMMIVGEIGHPVAPATARRSQWRLAGGPAGAEIGAGILAAF